MKISELVKKLNALKKEHGDIDVVANQKAFHEEFQNENYSHEDIEVIVDKIPVLNMDTGKISKRKYKHATIYPEAYL